jgi:signal transduction histidine kinase
MRPIRLLWAAGPVRALVETVLIDLAVLALLAWQAGRMSWYAISNGVFFVWAGSALWPAVRTALPRGSRGEQAEWEIRLSIAVSLATTICLSLAVRLFGWSDLWPEGSLARPPALTIALLSTGPAYLLARMAARLWLAWNRLRREHMRWALTHAQLTAVFAVLVAAIGLLAVATVLRPSPSLTPPQGLPASAIEWLMRTFLPVAGILSLITLGAVVVLFVPAALLSYLMARRITVRLEDLARATYALRQGDYGTRAKVSGEDEVAQVQADFNAMAAELEQTMRALQQERDKVSALLRSQRQLAAGVSHELRTPLAIIRGHLEANLAHWDESAPPALKRDLETIDAEAARLQALIEDLFELARAEAGGLALDMRTAAAGPVINARVAAMAPLAWQAKRVEVSAEIEPDLPPVFADEARLAQIVANLLHNAIRHTGPGGIVAAGAMADGERVRIEIRDTGEGIPPEDLPKIWMPYYQSGDARSEHGAAGLGLAIVKELTEAMGGTVDVQSTPGQGTCFTVWLRRA